LFLNSNFNC